MHRFATFALALALGLVACARSPAAVDPPVLEAGAAVDASPARDAMTADAPLLASDGGVFVTASHPAWPQVPGNSGVVLNDMKLVTVVTAGDPQGDDLFAFGDALVASDWWAEIAAEYALGTPRANVHVTGAAMTTDPTEADMTDYIASAIAGVPAAATDGDTMYILYLPSGVDVLDARGPNAACAFYTGYHAAYGEGGDAWGVVQHCPVTGTTVTDFESMTLVGSHEIIEGATDPQPGNGWTMPQPDVQAPWTQPPWIAAGNGEIADMCGGTQMTEGAFTYQRIWSNAAAARGGDPCIPPSAVPYGGMSAPQPWYTVGSGGSVAIPVTGFSDAPTAPWLAGALAIKTSGPTFDMTFTSDTTLDVQGNSYPALDNGASGFVNVTAPAAASGNWAAIALESEDLGAGGDAYHLWVVGVYIP